VLRVLQNAAFERSFRFGVCFVAIGGRIGGNILVVTDPKIDRYAEVGWPWSRL